MLVLDLRRLRWSSVAGPTPREHLAVTASGGRVYVLAGRLGGIDTNLAVLEVYAPGRGWHRLPPVPSPRGGTGAAVLGGRIVSAGGEEPAGTIGSVYAYDIARARWSRLPFPDTLEDLQRPGRTRGEWTSDGDRPSVEGYRLLGGLATDVLYPD